MRKSIEDREFTIQITYTSKDLNEILKWYVNTAMPPIYKNYDLENEEIANKIEEEAVKTLIKLGSQQIITEHLQQNIVVFTPDNDEEE